MDVELFRDALDELRESDVAELDDKFSNFSLSVLLLRPVGIRAGVLLDVGLVLETTIGFRLSVWI